MISRWQGIEGGGLHESESIFATSGLRPQEPCAFATKPEHPASSTMGLYLWILLFVLISSPLHLHSV